MRHRDERGLVMGQWLAVGNGTRAVIHSFYSLPPHFYICSNICMMKILLKSNSVEIKMWTSFNSKSFLLSGPSLTMSGGTLCGRRRGLGCPSLLLSSLVPGSSGAEEGKKGRWRGGMGWNSYLEGAIHGSFLASDALCIVRIHMLFSREYGPMERVWAQLISSVSTCTQYIFATPNPRSQGCLPDALSPHPASLLPSQFSRQESGRSLYIHVFNQVQTPDNTCRFLSSAPPGAGFQHRLCSRCQPRASTWESTHQGVRHHFSFLQVPLAINGWIGPLLPWLDGEDRMKRAKALSSPRLMAPCFPNSLNSSLQSI